MQHKLEILGYVVEEASITPANTCCWRYAASDDEGYIQLSIDQPLHWLPSPLLPGCAFSWNETRCEAVQLRRELPGSIRNEEASLTFGPQNEIPMTTPHVVG